MKIRFIRYAKGYERVQYRHKALARVWADEDFQFVYAPEFRRVVRERVAVAFVCGSKAAIGIEKAGGLRAKFRIYLPDWRRGPENLTRQFRVLKSSRYDMVLLSQPIDIERYRLVHERVFFIDRGFDPDVFYPSAEKEFDIVFCGNLKAFGRLARLEKLADRLPGKVVWQQGLSHAEMAPFLRHGKIGWNQILRGPPEHTIGINYRVWETVGSGILLLTSYSKHIPLKDGVHCIMWRNDVEMLEKAEYYLMHDDEREAIARRGYEEALAKHTWTHRALRIKELVERYV